MNWARKVSWLSVICPTHVNLTLPYIDFRGLWWCWCECAVYLDGKVVPHVFPKFEVTQEGHPSASSRRSVIVKKPPNSVQHADQPEACEKQVEEQENACGCWGRNKIFGSLGYRTYNGSAVEHYIWAIHYICNQVNVHGTLWLLWKMSIYLASVAVSSGRDDVCGFGGFC